MYAVAVTFLGVTYFHERRAGTRTNNAAAFGFNNVIELPEPLKYITQDFGLNGSSRTASSTPTSPTTSAPPRSLTYTFGQ